MPGVSLYLNENGHSTKQLAALNSGPIYMLHLSQWGTGSRMSGVYVVTFLQVALDLW